VKAVTAIGVTAAIAAVAAIGAGAAFGVGSSFCGRIAKSALTPIAGLRSGGLRMLLVCIFTMSRAMSFSSKNRNRGQSTFCGEAAKSDPTPIAASSHFSLVQHQAKAHLASP
jgi:hypothetical protein